MVHRHPGLGISQAENPIFFPSFQIDCPFPWSMQKKFPFTPSLRSFPAKCSLVLFPYCNHHQNASLFGACPMKCTYVSTQPFGYTFFQTQPNKSSTQIITNENSTFPLLGPTEQCPSVLIRVGRVGQSKRGPCFGIWMQ